MHILGTVLLPGITREKSTVIVDRVQSLRKILSADLLNCCHKHCSMQLLLDIQH